MDILKINLLGRHEVCLNQSELHLPSRKARALLFYLAVEPPHTHSRIKLAALLWPDESGSKAGHNLRQALSALRKALDLHGCADMFLGVDRHSISFTSGSGVLIDAALFRDYTSSALQSFPGQSRPDIRRLKKAAALYSGPFLDDFDIVESGPFEEWVVVQRESLHRQAIRVYERLLTYHRSRHDTPSVLEAGEKLLDLAPWDEQNIRLLMSVYTWAGQVHTALSIYDAGVKYLRESLDLEPSPDTTHLFNQLRSGCIPDSNTQISPALLSNLTPEASPFVGRQNELDQLSTLIAKPAVRLITITGPGGIGKTRLALHAAAEQKGLFPDGVFSISLDAIHSPERILPLIAHSLDIEPFKEQPLKERIFSVLQDKQLLLILDNFEHLQQAAALISDLLQHTRNLQLIVTSRQQLDIQQEWSLHLSSMALPPAVVSSALIAHVDSTDLFLQTLNRMGLDLSGGETTLQLIADICRLVQGSPLGIELAAASARSHTLNEIKQQIESNLGSLTASSRNLPERHRSLRATFEHSWQLLDPSTRESLRRLSIFQGPFHPDSALSVANTDRETLGTLLAGSLLVREQSRFAFHPLVHQFAQEKLAEDPETQQTLLHLFASEFAAFLEAHCPDLHSEQRVQALNNLRNEENNISAAWEWMHTNQEPGLIQQAMPGLFRFYLLQGRFQEGLSAFSHEEEYPGPQSAQTAGWLHMYRGVFASNLGEYETAEESFQQAQAFFLEIGVDFPAAACRIHQAHVAIAHGQYEFALSLLNQAQEVFQDSADSWWLAFGQFLTGDALYRLGKIRDARAVLETSLEYARSSGDPARISASLNTLADVMCFQGEFNQAEALFRECLEISRSIQDQHSASIHLNNLGTIFHLQEKFADARFAYLESLNICKRNGDRYGEAIALSNLGEIAMQNGDFQQAHEHFTEGLQISYDINNTWSTLACLTNLADISIQTRSMEDGIGYLRSALQHAVDTQTISVLPALLLLAARIAVDRGKIQNASHLLAHVLLQEDVDELLRSQAAQLVQTHGLTLPEEITGTLAHCAADLLTTLKAPEF